MGGGVQTWSGFSQENFLITKLKPSIISLAFYEQNFGAKNHKAVFWV